MPASALPVPATHPALLWAVLLAAGTGWGSTQLFSKLVVNGGHHPLGIALTATLLGTVLVTGALLISGRRLPLDWRHVRFYLVCGLLGTAVPNTVSYWSMQELSVGVVSIVISAVPLLTFAAAVALGLDRPERRRIVGIICGATAMLLLTVPETSLPDPDQVVWIALPLLAAATYAAEGIYLSRAQPDGTDPLQTMCGLLWAALILLLPVVAATGNWVALWPLDVPELSLIAMTVLHVGSYGGYVWMVARGGPVFAAQVAYVVTASGVFWGMAVLGERHSPWVWLALALMMIGLTLVQPRRALSPDGPTP